MPPIAAVFCTLAFAVLPVSGEETPPLDRAACTHRKAVRLAAGLPNDNAGLKRCRWRSDVFHAYVNFLWKASGRKAALRLCREQLQAEPLDLPYSWVVQQCQVNLLR